MHQYRLRIEHLSPDQQLKEIEDFKSCGWDYIGDSKLADIHIFAVFEWNKPSEPVIPAKYGKYKVVNPIKCEDLI